LLARGCQVKVIVRATENLPENASSHSNLPVVHASILDLGAAEMARHLVSCSTLVSCLGHNLSIKGMFGSPRRLVTDATRRLCDAVKAGNPQKPVKFILMNTTGNSNRDLNEPVSFGQKCVIWLLRLLLPPHADNEEAADYLRVEVGARDGTIEWVVVRPDGLVDEDETTEYALYPSPIRSAIFDAGTTSRINVAQFMSELIVDDDLWDVWKGKMPVIYNQESHCAPGDKN
jgi:hypothetical protein